MIEAQAVNQALVTIVENQEARTVAALKGLPEDVILTVMESWAGKCSPPMDSRELRQTVQSVLRYPGAGGIPPVWEGADASRLF